MEPGEDGGLYLMTVEVTKQCKVQVVGHSKDEVQ